MDQIDKLIEFKNFIKNIEKINVERTKSFKTNYEVEPDLKIIKKYSNNKDLGNIIFIPNIYNHYTRENLSNDPSSLYDGKYWAITLDRDKINCSYLTLWLKEFPMWSNINIGEEFSKENISNIKVPNLDLNHQEILYRNMSYLAELKAKMQLMIYSNIVVGPTELKLDDIVSHIPDLEIESLLKKEEFLTHEYKSSIRYNTKEKKITDWLINSSLKTIAAFLNSDGGCLIIGVNDNKEVLGIDLDGFKSNDEWIRFLKDKIKSKLGINFLETFIKIETREYNNKNVGIIRCAPLPKKDHCLLDEKLYVRKGPASHELALKDILDWQKNRITSE